MLSFRLTKHPTILCLSVRYIISTACIRNLVCVVLGETQHILKQVCPRRKYWTITVLSSFGINTTSDEQDLPSLYLTPKLHKTSYKQRYIAGSSKCSTKPLSKLLTILLSAVKTGIQKTVILFIRTEV